MSVQQISMSAWHAIKAAEMVRTHGRFAASQYAKKHGVSSLYRLARQLSAVQ